jgi:hypothetical protein
MLLPFRTASNPPKQVLGYSINTVTGARFPSAGTYAVYNCPGSERFFEALDTVTSSDDVVDVYTLDFSKKSRSTRDTFNPCQHYKRVAQVNPGNCTYDSLSSGQVWHNFNIPTQIVWDMNWLSTNVSPVVAFGTADKPFTGLAALWQGSDLGVYKDSEGFEGRACEYMLPGIRPQSSLINSIYELKDMKTIPHTMDRISKALDQLKVTSVGKITSLLTDKPSWWAKKTLKAILNASGDVYLQNSFNLSPLLQDISNVWFGVQNVEDKLKQLVAQARQPIVHHWGAPLTKLKDEDRTDVGANNVLVPANVLIRRVVKYPLARFSATLEFSYEMPNYSSKELLARGLADYHGLGLSPQIVWNAIPWSFVVDWLVGVGPWLSQFRQRQLEIVTHISKFGYSVHIKRETSCIHSVAGLVSMVTEESYYRTPSAVPLVSSIQLSGLNSKEFSLGGTLAYLHVAH